MCCSAAHLWTLLKEALLWPDRSPLLHFPCNLGGSAVRLPLECRQDSPPMETTTLPHLPQPPYSRRRYSTTAARSIEFLYPLSLPLNSFSFCRIAVRSLAGQFHPRVARQGSVSAASSLFRIAWQRQPHCVIGSQLFIYFFFFVNAY